MAFHEVNETVQLFQQIALPNHQEQSKRFHFYCGGASIHFKTRNRHPPVVQGCGRDFTGYLRMEIFFKIFLILNSPSSFGEMILLWLNVKNKNTNFIISHKWLVCVLLCLLNTVNRRIPCMEVYEHVNNITRCGRQRTCLGPKLWAVIYRVGSYNMVNYKPVTPFSYTRGHLRETL